MRENVKKIGYNRGIQVKKNVDIKIIKSGKGEVFRMYFRLFSVGNQILIRCTSVLCARVHLDTSQGLLYVNMHFVLSA